MTLPIQIVIINKKSGRNIFLLSKMTKSRKTKNLLLILSMRSRVKYENKKKLKNKKEKTFLNSSPKTEYVLEQSRWNCFNFLQPGKTDDEHDAGAQHWMNDLRVGAADDTRVVDSGQRVDLRKRDFSHA